MSEQVWWYATRAAGLMTWATATASVVIGLMLSTRAIRARTGPWFLDLHRFLSGITVVFLVAHVFTLWADSFEEFGLKEIFVPGASTWKPEAIAWGIVAAYLIIAVELSSLMRSRINGKVWRVIHFSSFAAMIAGSYHAITAGSDVDNPITWVIAGIGCLLVFGLMSIRLERRSDPDEKGAGRLSDNRAILEEMRQRLADLHVPETGAHTQITLTPAATLPQRGPVSESLPGIESPEPTSAPADGAVAFDDDPFAAVPLANGEPELGDWAGPSSADPFSTSVPDTGVADAADPFDSVDPFDSFGLTGGPPEARDASADAPDDLFAAVLRNELEDDFVGNPFESAMPTPSVLDEPATPDAPAPGNDGPPPLPNAVDPITGEPDEAAYSAWLKDWLVYAERYGDEAPEDPDRL